MGWKTSKASRFCRSFKWHEKNFGRMWYQYKTLKDDDMRVFLAIHDDFHDEKNVVENFFSSKCHKLHFIL